MEKMDNINNKGTPKDSTLVMRTAQPLFQK